MKPCQSSTLVPLKPHLISSQITNSQPLPYFIKQMDGLGQTGGQPDISFPNFGDQMYLPCEFPQYMFPVPDYSYFQQIPPFYPDDLFKQMQQF